MFKFESLDPPTQVAFRKVMTPILKEHGTFVINWEHTVLHTFFSTIRKCYTEWQLSSKNKVAFLATGKGTEAIYNLTRIYNTQVHALNHKATVQLARFTTAVYNAFSDALSS